MYSASEDVRQPCRRAIGARSFLVLMICALVATMGMASMESSSLSGPIAQEVLSAPARTLLGFNGNDQRTELPLAAASGLQALTDAEMGDVTGQALFVSDKIVGTGSQATGTAGLTFYRAGLDAILEMNTNIKLLELGRTGGAPGVVPLDAFGVIDNSNTAVLPDLLAENVAFGCVADAGGTCVDSQSGSATQLKPLVLTRPYFEFAIENDNNPAAREVVGLRLGAEGINGPMSFGQMKVFSGYLTATAQLTLEAMTDAAGTCGAHESGASTSQGGGRWVVARVVRTGTLRTGWAIRAPISGQGRKAVRAVAAIGRVTTGFP